MRATEFITEIFQPGKKNWGWKFRGGEEAAANFTVGDRDYQWLAFSNPHSNPTKWEIQFRLLRNDTDPEYLDLFGRTGTGNSAQVLSTAVDITREFIKEYGLDKVEEITFNAKEDSRIGLYAKMIQRLLPDWDLYQKYSKNNGMEYHLTDRRAYDKPQNKMTEGSSNNIPTIGINVRNDKDIDYASLIVDGKKKYESRKTDSLRPYVGKTVGIVRTGNGPAVAIGQVTIGEPIIVDAEKFNKLRNQHLVPKSSKFDIDIDSTKYLYPMINPVRWDNEKPIKSKGIISRKIQEQGLIESTLSVDVPNEEWLQDAIDYAKSKSPDRNGLPYMGKTTATARRVNVPVDLLRQIPGMRREQSNVRNDDLVAIMKIMNTTGKLPLHGHTGEEYKPFINVAYDGSAWVNEGNHRIMAAAKLGWSTLPIEISYFDGGERIKSGPMYPPKIGL